MAEADHADRIEDGPGETIGITEGPGLSFEPPAEVDRVPLTIVTGAVPDDLSGSLFRNGPALYKRGGQIARHPLDGDGFIARYNIEKTGVTLTGKYVRTKEFLEEKTLKRRRHRVFGTPSASWFTTAFVGRVRNASNTAVVWHGGRLLSLWEGGLPYVVDPSTLETVAGEYDFEGGLKVSRLFSAHPAIDPDTGELFNYGSPLRVTRKPVVTLQHLDAHGVVQRVNDFVVDKRYYFHDLAITKKYVVVYMNSAWLQTGIFLLGLTEAANLGYASERPSKLLIARRDDLSFVRMMDGPVGFSFHDINAFDDGDDLVLDVAMYDGPPRWWTHLGPDWVFRNTGFGVRPYPMRIRIDVAGGTCATQPLGDVSMEMTSIHPAKAAHPYRYTYGIASLLPRTNSIVKLDVRDRISTVRDLGPNIFPDEPIFVPRRNSDAEDDGYLVFPALNTTTKRSGLWVLDARDLMKPPLLVAEHRAPLSVSFHGVFVPQLF